MTQHTPGNWTAHGCTVTTADNWQDGRNYGGSTVAITYQPDADTCPCDEMLGNAQLIAAAPELLKACRAALMDLIDDETYAQHQTTIKTLESAIAKVEGTL